MRKLLLIACVLLGGLNASGQNLSARLGIVPYHWLDYQGVPAFLELGVEWEPIYRLAFIGAVKILDDSFDENGRFERPGVEVSIQPRFYFDLEEGNDGAYIALPVSYAIHGNYIAVNSITRCQTRFTHNYYEFSALIGFKTSGKIGLDFFAGPSYRTTSFYSEDSCENTGEHLVVTRKKLLFDIGARLTYRL